MEGFFGNNVKELPFWSMIIKLWPGNWEENLKRINKKVDEENGKGGTQENGTFRKLWHF